LFFEPLFPRWHVPTVHDPWFSDKVPTVRLGLLLAIRLLGTLNGGTGLGYSALCIKCHPIGLIPPNGNAVAIPILKNVVGFEQLVVPLVPLLMLWIVENNCLWWLTRLNRSFK
jgi:hypothetical protein